MHCENLIAAAVTFAIICVRVEANNKIDSCMT
uniref:Uncharacterized protein n=1 Tax=Anguilla anguilla TaxID=7936 RepID=A0A0E9W8S9_ANGAN